MKNYPFSPSQRSSVTSLKEQKNITYWENRTGALFSVILREGLEHWDKDIDYPLI